MKLSFHGADQDVTGSCHLLDCLGRRILVDCGMRQGSRELAYENAAPFGFDPAGIDTVLLTHAHLDHCGRLPLLVKRGFRGEIIATAATRELARIVIVDAAHLQEEEERRGARYRHSHGDESPPDPLYSMLDALAALDQFGRAATYGTPIDLAPSIRATFFDAGHILGSASVLIEVVEQGKSRSVLFSGDIGNAGRPLLKSPATPASADFIVMESTYGDRLHRPLAASIDELYAAVTDTFARGGNVIVPTFALERAQEILYFLRQGTEEGKVPMSAQVFLDSPMAISATEIFRHHPECLEPSIAALFQGGGDPFHLPNLHLVRETADSMAINRVTGGAVILAGAGMCTGGRVRHHLRYNLGRSECSVVFVGFAAIGTPARRIIDGAHSVRLLGEDIPVRARIHTINGFSAHADQHELINWHSDISGNKITFVVHGELAAMAGLVAKLTAPRVERPTLHQAYDL